MRYTDINVVAACLERKSDCTLLEMVKILELDYHEDVLSLLELLKKHNVIRENLGTMSIHGGTSVKLYWND